MELLQACRLGTKSRTMPLKEDSFSAYTLPAKPFAPLSAGVPEKLKAVLDHFGISIAEAHELAVLQDYEVVIIADDSESMKSGAEPAHMRKLESINDRTRWNQLQETVFQMIDVASCFHDTGVDVFFLNRDPVFGVNSSADEALSSAFEAPPKGGTPLTQTFRTAMRNRGDRKVLLFILADGEPTGGKDDFISTIKSALAANELLIQIMACTANVEEIGWLNALDRELKVVDVTDDYYSEREQVLKAKKKTTFSPGDWCMKAMLGPLSDKFDGWDEHEEEQLEPPVCGCFIQ